MSIFVFGHIVCNDITNLLDSLMDFRLVEFCVNHGVGIRFFPPQCQFRDSEINIFTFQFSDNFYISNCEKFMAPIYYSEDSTQIYGKEELQDNINVLYEFCRICLSYSEVDSVDLMISVGEVDDCDYITYNTTVEKISAIIMNQYLSISNVPTLKLIVKKLDTEDTFMSFEEKRTQGTVLCVGKEHSEQFYNNQGEGRR